MRSVVLTILFAVWATQANALNPGVAGAIDASIKYIQQTGASATQAEAFAAAMKASGDVSAQQVESIVAGMFASAEFRAAASAGSVSEETIASIAKLAEEMGSADAEAYTAIFDAQIAMVAQTGDAAQQEYASTADVSGETQKIIESSAVLSEYAGQTCDTQSCLRGMQYMYKLAAGAASVGTQAAKSVVESMFTLRTADPAGVVLGETSKDSFLNLVERALLGQDGLSATVASTRLNPAVAMSSQLQGCAL